MSPNIPLSRRSMLQASGFGVLALSLPISLGTAVAATAAPAALCRASWLPVVGSRLGIVDGPALELSAVSDLARAADDAALRDLAEAFVLTFVGPASPGLESGIHEIEHPELGTVSLFVTPVGGAHGKQHYEAVVDRTVRLPEALSAPEVQGSAAEAQAAAEASSLKIAPAVGAKASTAAARRRLRVHARAARAGAKVVLDLSFPGVSLQAVSVKLCKGSKTAAHGEGAVRHGKAKITMRGRRHLARGRYDLVVTATDRRGEPVTVTRSVTVR